MEGLFLHQLLRNKDETLYSSKYLNYIQKSLVELVMGLQCFWSCRSNPYGWIWLLSRLFLFAIISDCHHTLSLSIPHTYGYLNPKAAEALIFMSQQTESWLSSHSIHSYATKVHAFCPVVLVFAMPWKWIHNHWMLHCAALSNFSLGEPPGNISLVCCLKLKPKARVPRPA